MAYESFKSDTTKLSKSSNDFGFSVLTSLNAIFSNFQIPRSFLAKAYLCENRRR